MGKIRVEECEIEGLKIIVPEVFGDERGYFMETYRSDQFAEAGIPEQFVQHNQSSSTKGVLRGMHFQKEFPQSKLVRVLSGRVYDVAVDLRPGSPTRGKWQGVELSGENRKMFFIPRGFAHGFLVLSDTAEFCYKCDDFYQPDGEGGIAGNDPKIGIEWPGLEGTYQGSARAEEYLLDGSPLILSEKDQNWPCLAAL